MTEAKIYDGSIDEMRPVTQADVAHLEQAKQAFMLTRKILKNMNACELRSDADMKSYLGFLKKLSEVE